MDKTSSLVNINETIDTNKMNKNTQSQEKQSNPTIDYSYVPTIARIAIYDDNISAPRIIEIKPDKTAEFIEHLTSEIYSKAQQLGGSIPYTAIREVTENFIHAQFSEIVVSILNRGKTIRFADQGPGISDKEKAQLPGFSSAIEPMKKYIRGVGSGLPIVKEYLNFTDGNITIEDNISTGAVITLNQEANDSTLNSDTSSNIDVVQIETNPSKSQTNSNFQNLENQTQINTQENSNQDINSCISKLNDKEKIFLSYLYRNGPMRITDLVNLTQTASSSTHATLKKLEQKNLITHDGNKKRLLTDFGISVAKTL